MSALDGSVVNTILPVVNHAFGSDVATIEWVVTVYLLIVSGVLLSVGRLGDMRGHKPMYVGGLAGFVASSALCGMSPSAHALIGFRAVQAIAASMLFANAPAILTRSFPPEQRGQALGLQGTMTYLGLTVGPSLGGWLTHQFGWRSVFYINVPVGLAALVLAAIVIPREHGSGRGERFDLLGAGLFMVGLVALLLALNQGHAWGWSSVPTLGLIGAAAVILGAFIGVERRVSAPMLDLSLFGSRVFSASAASAVLNYMCLYALVFVLPFYLIQGRGFGPAQAGLLMTAQPIVMAVAAPISGTLSDRIGARIPGTLGMVIMAAGLFFLSRLGPATPLPYLELGLAVVGLGTGIFVSPNNSALMGAAPRHRQGIAAGILATARNVGMVLGVGLSGALFLTVLAGGPLHGPGTRLFAATHLSLLVSAGIALLAAAASAVRGSGRGTPAGR